MDEVLNRVYWGNTVLNYLVAAGGIIAAWILLRIIKGKIIFLLKKLASRTDTSFDDLLVRASEKFILPYLYLLVNYSILHQLHLSLRTERVLDIAMLMVTTFFAARLVNFFIHGAVVVYMERKGEPSERISQLSGMLLMVKVFVWGIAVVMLADNLGYDVTTVIAGLGIGGIAIALAAQNILGDLFSYLVIFFDKPFEVGDFIVTGNDSGTVEKIGIKTTHVRSLGGQQLVMPNSEMVKGAIHNFKRLERRRVVFSVGVVYYTPAGRLREIPGLIKELIVKQENTTFDRVHLKSFGDFSINFEIVYYVESADYLVYMDKHHAISLDIFEKFEQEGIEFAFPTQTIFINKPESADKMSN